MASDAESSLGALPPELLQHVLSYLDTHDLKSARLVCSTFSRLGIAALFKEIAIVYKRSYFARLLEVSRHPYISRSIQSLEFQADMLESWRNANIWTTGFTQNDWAAESEESKAQCNDQMQIQDEQFDVHCLLRLLINCARLNRVTVVFGTKGAYTQTSGFPRSGFPELRSMSFSEWNTRLEQRLNTLQALASAAEQAGRMPKDLELRGVDIDDFRIGNVATDKICEFFRHLHGLDIWLKNLERYREGRYNEEESESRIRDLMRAASGSVKTLGLQFPDRPSSYTYAWLPLMQVLSSTEWPQLHKLWIAFASADKTLVDFLLQRVPSLKQLELTQLHLTESSWHMVFLLICGQIAGLVSAAVEGCFSNEDAEEAEIGFSDAGREKWKAEMEKFLVEGGVPPDLSGVIRYLPVKPMTGPDHDSDYSEASTDSEPGTSEDFEEDWEEDDLGNLDDLGPTTETYLTWTTGLASDGEQ